jgi:hypothetical protein
LRVFSSAFPLCAKTIPLCLPLIFTQRREDAKSVSKNSLRFDVAMAFILGLVTFVVALLTFAVFVGLPMFVIIRYVLKRQSQPKPVTQIVEEEIKNT